MVTRAQLDILIRRLFALNAPKDRFAWSAVFTVLAQVLITIIVLLSFTDLYKERQDVDCIDLFAGAGRVAKVSRGLGLTALALDISYHSKPRVFDINESSGFLRLGVKANLFIPWPLCEAMLGGLAGGQV